MVKLNILCVSHEVTSIRSLHRRSVQCRPYCRRLVDTWFSLIDFKEVTVHWAHGNAVVNHTFCVFWWLIFQLPKSPVSCPSLGRYWCPAPDINQDLNVSSVKTDFRYKRSFLFDCWCKDTTFLNRKQEYGKKSLKKLRKSLIYSYIRKSWFCIFISHGIQKATKVSLRKGVIKGH